MTTKNITYAPSGVCSRAIEVHLDGDIVSNVKFTGGCGGNTQGVAALVQGMKVDDVLARLKGIDCKGKGTSCPDQLCRAIETLRDK